MDEKPIPLSAGIYLLVCFYMCSQLLFRLFANFNVVAEELILILAYMKLRMVYLIHHCCVSFEYLCLSLFLVEICQI